jgi:hypothetical protein
MSASRITIRSDEATYVAADSRHPVEVLNAAGRDCFHKNAPDVDSGDTKLELGKSVELTEGAWFVTAAGSTELNVREMDSVHVNDNLSVAGTAVVTGATTLSGAATVGGKLHAEGEVEVEGDINHDGTKVGFFGVAPAERPNVKPAAEVSAKELCEALEKLGLVQ